MNIRGRHWLAALSIAVLVHGSLILLLWEPAESGAANLGVGGMEVSFGMAGGAPGAAAVSPPEKETLDTPEEAETVEPAETTPVETVETAALEAPVEEIAPAEPVEVEAVTPDTTEAVEVREVKPKTVTAKISKKPEPPKEAKPEEPKPVEPKPVKAAEPSPVRPAAPKEVASVAPPKEAPPTKTSSVAGSAGKSGTQKSNNTGSGETSSSGGRPGSADSYFARLQAWLEQHKEYPSSARRRRQEGTAVLTFTMDHRGEVLMARIQRGTGFSSLDEEVIRMIKRAAPLPPLPDDFPEGNLTLSVPVQFQLY